MRRLWPILLLFLISLPTPQLQAQVISGFASVPWGASQADIEEAWGRPSRVAQDGSFKSMRYYAQDFAGPKPIRGWNMIFGFRNDVRRTVHARTDRGRGAAQDGGRGSFALQPPPGKTLP